MILTKLIIVVILQYMYVKSLCYIAYTVLYVNYMSIRQKKIRVDNPAFVVILSINHLKL